MIAGERMEMFTILCYFARHAAGGCPGKLEFAEYAAFFRLRVHGFYSPAFLRRGLAFRLLEDSSRLAETKSITFISWRKDMERHGLAPSSIRRKLSALSSLFDYLCERNAVTGNPIDGVKRPMTNGNEGSTPALGDRKA